MNNNQFRRLVLDNPKHQDGEQPTTKATPIARSSLGAKRSSFRPMTPRTVQGSQQVDFSRQVRERNAAFQPTKKFKSSAPKGVKLGAAYTDRARARAEAEEDGDGRAKRIEALEEQMKLGQISTETFEALRDEITGGDIASTHLVKGLDRRLLERVRRGEDVLGMNNRGNPGSGEAPDVDEELEKLGQQDVEVIKKQTAAKKGTMVAPSSRVAGVKRSRDEIMAELKAQRLAAEETKTASQLDDRWRKVGDKENTRIEIDRKGREVLITVDEDGMVKKKVRKLPRADDSEVQVRAAMPDANKSVLGADAIIPERQRTATPIEDDDIFEGVGTEYNPLGNEDEDGDSSSDGESDGDQSKPIQMKIDNLKSADAPRLRATEQASAESEPKQDSKRRNYFKDNPEEQEEPERDRLAGVQDLLKKAAKMDGRSGEDSNAPRDEAEQARLKKHAAMLSQSDRDFDDMDMGFGSNRYDDGEEEGDDKTRLAEWKGAAGVDDRDDDSAKKDGAKRKRKPKKRKGDVNNAADIMRVIEKRKA